jgi:hypothetical protein
LAKRALDDGDEDFIAVGEVGIDGGGRDPGQTGDGAQRQGVVSTTLLEQRAGGIHDVLAQSGALAALVAAPWLSFGGNHAYNFTRVYSDLSKRM